MCLSVCACVMCYFFVVVIAPVNTVGVELRFGWTSGVHRIRGLCAVA